MSESVSGISIICKKARMIGISSLILEPVAVDFTTGHGVRLCQPTGDEKQPGRIKQLTGWRCVYLVAVDRLTLSGESCLCKPECSAEHLFHYFSRHTPSLMLSDGSSQTDGPKYIKHYRYHGYRDEALAPDVCADVFRKARSNTECEGIRSFAHGVA